jgi:hypothetical protein
MAGRALSRELWIPAHRLLGVCSRVAWRLLRLTYQARQTPQAPCHVALRDPEWQALTAVY